MRCRAPCARGAAALEVHRRRVVEDPEAVTQQIRTMVATANGSDPRSPQDALAFFRRQGCFAGHQDLGYLATGLAQVWNLLEVGSAEEAHARVGLLLVAADQTCFDNRWEMSFLVSHAEV